MQDQRNKCKGTRKDGKPCEKFPLIGEDFCEKHHPTKILRRKLKRSVAINLGLVLMIILFIWDRYSSNKSTKSIQTQMSQSEISLKEDFRQHSLGERILDSQYNPPKLTELLKEVMNLMNNDPDFKKKFFIDSRGVRIQTDKLVYGKDFRINFRISKAEKAFDEFLRSGRKSLTIHENDYDFFYVLRKGEVVDLFRNKTFDLGRDFPQLPPLNISTIDPTGEYLCTSILNIQVDSIVSEYVYISNGAQNSPFKISLTYNLIKGTAQFDQLKDIYFNEESPFYSVDQEISYYEFWLALLSNARVRIRNAVTGDSILTTEHFLPVNILPGESHKSINTKLSVLRTLKRIQNIWGITFSESNMNKEEFAYLRAIAFSFDNGAELVKYPFKFTLPEDEAKKIIDRKANIQKGQYRIICNKNSINLLDQKLLLGRLVIVLPPSQLTYEIQEGVVVFSVSPIKKEETVVYKFTDLSGLSRPSDIIYSEIIPPGQDQSFISFVNSIEMSLDSWENTKLNEMKNGFD